MRAEKEKLGCYHSLFRARRKHSPMTYEKEQFCPHAMQGHLQLEHISFTSYFHTGNSLLCSPSNIPQVLMLTLVRDLSNKNKGKKELSYTYGSQGSS